jgi:hypothetical protein
MGDAKGGVSTHAPPFGKGDTCCVDGGKVIDFSKEEQAVMKTALIHMYLRKKPQPYPPPYDDGGDKERDYVVKLRAYLTSPDNVKHTILDHIRSMRDLCSNRYSKTCEAIGNEMVRAPHGKNSDALIVRFIAQAKDHCAREGRYQGLMLKVLENELPREILDFDPVDKVPTCKWMTT